MIHDSYKSFRLSNETMAAIKHKAQAQGLSTSEVIRQALRAYLTQQDNSNRKAPDQP